MCGRITWASRSKSVRFSGSGAGPQSLNFWKAPVRCWCWRSRRHLSRSKALSSLFVPIELGTEQTSEYQTSRAGCGGGLGLPPAVHGCVRCPRYLWDGGQCSLVSWSAMPPIAQRWHQGRDEWGLSWTSLVSRWQRTWRCVTYLR